MDPICQHCYELIVGNAYRVTSKEEGITMLDIVVCSRCFMEAKRLGLHAEEIVIGSKQSFSSTPRESRFTTRHLISTRQPQVLVNRGSADRLVQVPPKAKRNGSADRRAYLSACFLFKAITRLYCRTALIAEKQLLQMIYLVGDVCINPILHRFGLRSVFIADSKTPLRPSRPPHHVKSQGRQTRVGPT
jgi:hypothetical protein